MSQPSQPSQPSQADILAALQAQAGSSRRQRPATTGYGDHAHPHAALTVDEENGTRIYCPRDGCGSLILLPRTAVWITGPGNIIPLDDGSPFTPTPPLPHPTSDPTTEKDGQNGFWHIKGGPMAFENVGYSRATSLVLPPTAPGNGEGKKVKWLICAECDLGPIGWSFEGAQESWLDVGRVRYGS